MLLLGLRIDDAQSLGLESTLEQESWRVRYTWIDGIYKEVDCCHHCPFLSTELEIGATCQYPLNPAEYIDLADIDETHKDCPLRVKT